MDSNDTTSESNLAERRLGALTRKMLEGKVHYLEGAQEVIKLRNQIGAYANDPDFMPFVAILAEIKTLPCETHVTGWSKAASKEETLEIEKSLIWAKSFSLAQCQSLVERYPYNIDE